MKMKRLRSAQESGDLAAIWPWLTRPPPGFGSIFLAFHPRLLSLSLIRMALICRTTLVSFCTISHLYSLAC